MTLHTEMLVASRADTVKAHKAAAKGVLVIDYRTVVAECLDGEVERTNAQPDLFIDSLQPSTQPALAVEDLL